MGNMDIILGGFVIPKPTTFLRKTVTNEIDVKTLEGVLYTDFRDRGREWVLGWNNILAEPDWENLTSLYSQQYVTKQYTSFVFPKYFIDTTVKIEVSDEQIRYNGKIIESASITLKEKLPLSPVPL